MTADSAKSSDQRIYLLAALKEAQDTVRSYDTKAQIVGIGFIFTLGILKGFSDNLDGGEDITIFTMAASWFLAIGPIIMFGLVLYPSRGGMDALSFKKMGIKEMFYFGTSQTRDFEEYLIDMETCDWQKELSFELMKSSRLREIKRRRFVLALGMSAISLMVIALHQIFLAT